MIVPRNFVLLEEWQADIINLKDSYDFDVFLYTHSKARFFHVKTQGVSTQTFEDFA